MYFTQSMYASLHLGCTLQLCCSVCSLLKNIFDTHKASDPTPVVTYALRHLPFNGLTDAEEVTMTPERTRPDPEVDVLPTEDHWDATHIYDQLPNLFQRLSVSFDWVFGGHKITKQLTYIYGSLWLHDFNFAAMWLNLYGCLDLKLLI